MVDVASGRPDDDAAFFRQLVEEVQDFAIYRLTPDGRVASWNRGAERIFRYGAEGVLGKHFSLFFTEQDRAAARPDELLRLASSTGRAEDEGFRVRGDGAHIWTNGIITSLHGESGQIIGFAKITRDLTERRRAEQTLRLRDSQLEETRAAHAAAEAAAAGLSFLLHASEALASSLDYEQILQGVADMAVSEYADWCAIDVAEHGQLKRIAVSHPDPARVALAKRYAELYPPDPNAPTGAWNVLRTGEAEFYPEISEALLDSQIKDPKQLAMIKELGLRSAITVPLAGRGGVVGVLTLVQAESERRLTEQDLWISRQLGRHAGLAIESALLHRELEIQNAQLTDTAAELEQQTEELQTQAMHMEDLMGELEASNEELHARTLEAEEANRAKAEFLATMSHELRTPLNAIFGYADLLDMGLHGPVTPAQSNALDRIKRNQRSLLALINDVLNFAKVEAGKLEFVIADIDVRDLITGLEAVVAPQIQAHGLESVFECEDDQLRLRGERERVEQILLNLLTNAIKFTPSGGRIIVSSDADQESVRICVKDTGVGIPAERLAAVFDPFVQLSRSAEDSDDRGVGLGLAISRNLAVAMGGEISVTSEPGNGSEFCLKMVRAS